MKADIMEPAKPKQKKEIVVFEVNDKGRENEFSKRVRYSRNDDEYSQLFKSFLQSLGYEFKDEKFCSYVTINGIRYEIGTRNASYMSYNAWTRKAAIRKPENRFITFVGMRIHFNVEFDAGKLRKKIEEAKNRQEKQQEEVRRYDQLQIDNTLLVGRHFGKSKTDLYLHINSVYISQGEITLQLDNHIGSITLESDGTLREIDYRPKPIKTQEDLDIFLGMTPDDMNTIEVCFKAVQRIPNLPEELSLWVKKAYGQIYDVVNDKVKK